MDKTPVSASSDHSITEIFQALKKGLGHDRVNDGNVDALIAMAAEEGDPQTELLLREWRSPCGDDPENPVLAPSNPPPARS